jgi:hypothetical protein
METLKQIEARYLPKTYSKGNWTSKELILTREDALSFLYELKDTPYTCIGLDYWVRSDDGKDLGEVMAYDFSDELYGHYESIEEIKENFQQLLNDAIEILEKEWPSNPRYERVLVAPYSVESLLKFYTNDYVFPEPATGTMQITMNGKPLTDEFVTKQAALFQQYNDSFTASTK